MLYLPLCRYCRN